MATSEGVYYLREIKKYAQAEILVRDKGPQTIQLQQITKEATLKPHIQEPVKTRKSIFSQLFGKKQVVTDTKTITEKPSQEQPVLISPQIKLPEPQYFKKVPGKLKSVNYIYTKIEGIDEKCKQLVPAGNEILAATNKGLFAISGYKATNNW